MISLNVKGNFVLFIVKMYIHTRRESYMGFVCEFCFNGAGCAGDTQQR